MFRYSIFDPAPSRRGHSFSLFVWTKACFNPFGKSTNDLQPAMLTMTLPYYYSRLRPFREVFRAGIPVLCFHHIKAPSHGARLKWMYVSPRIFARQMAELQYEGLLTSEPFGSHALFDTEGPAPAHLAQCSSQPGGFASSSEVTRSDTNPNRKVVLSFDDGFRDVFDHALPVLQHNRFCGITFLVSDLLGKSNEWQLRMGDVKEPLMDAVQVREWLAAGQGIGSHTKTHPHLTQLSLADAREEITASKKSLEDRFS